MVAHLVRLKWQLLRNGLRRSVPQLIGLVLGGLYGLGILVLAVAGLVALRFTASAETAASVVPFGGSLLTLGWAVLPLVAFGVDQTLDPARFATFAVPRRQLLAGMLGAAMVSVPAAVTAVLSLATAITWSRTVLATLVALVAGLIGVLTCVVLSRAVTAGASAVAQSRRGREIGSTVAVLLLVAVAVLGPSLGDLLARPGLLTTVSAALGWTPLGLAWSAPAQVATGAVGAGLLRLVLAAVVLAGLVALWDLLLRRALEDPRATSSPRSPAGNAGLGWFGRLPGTPAGAIAARSLTYWRRDPRYVVSLGMLPLLPVALVLPSLGDGSPLWLLGMAPGMGYLLGWGMHNDLAYDGTAFWTHVATGAPGIADRLGRLVPTAALAVVLVPGYAVLGSALTGRWDLLPALLGMGIGVLLAGFAIACVTGVVKPYPVPQAGESPFSSPPGAAGLTMLVQAVTGTAVVVLSLPFLVPGVLAVLGRSELGWACLALALLVGPAYLLVGLRQGAKIFERRAPELLADLARIR